MLKRLVGVLVVSVFLSLFVPKLVRAVGVFGGLSQARTDLTGVAIGTKVLFAGGMTGPAGGFNFSDVVDIYDQVTGVVSVTHLPSGARSEIVAGSAGDKVVFYGGEAGISNNPSNAVDIYDASSETWSFSYRQPRSGHTTASLGDNIYFAGGLSSTYLGTRLIFYRTDTVDIYNSISNTWTSAVLSEARESLAGTSVCSKVIFAGGQYVDPYYYLHSSDVVDIYDTQSDTWSTASLSQARYDLAAVTVGNKAYFMGGRESSYVKSDRIDVYDCDTDSWSTMSTPLPGSIYAAAVIGRKIYTYGDSRYDPFVYPNLSNIVDVFDTSTNTWGVEYLRGGRWGVAAVSLGDKAYFAGGYGRTLWCCTMSYVYTVDTITGSLNSPPVVVAGSDVVVDEGQGVVFDGSGSTDPDGVSDITSYAWDFGDGSAGSGATPNHTYVDNGSYTATLTVADTAGHISTDTVGVTVNNAAPTVGSLAPIAPVLPGVEVNTSAELTDPGILDTHTASFDWGDGVTTSGLVVETGGSGSGSGSHTYGNPGVYTVTLTVTDKDGGVGISSLSVTILTPDQATQNLIDVVVSFNLQNGIENSLDAKLSAAIGALSDLNEQNNVAAINALQAFISAVEAQRDSKITSAQADQLIGDAQEIINYLTP